MTDYRNLWDRALANIRQSLTDMAKGEEYEKWFQPLKFESFDKQEERLIIAVPSAAYSEYIENNYLRLMGSALIPLFGKKLRMGYHITVDQQNNQSVIQEQGQEMVTARRNAQQKTPQLPEVDPQLDMTLNFRNYIEGESNKLSRSVGLHIAEHPKSTKFNPMFVYGASGVGKTHLINAIGVRAKELYPNLRVLYVSARIFQQQYTTAVQQNSVNDFIAFYQTLDMLIVDDIQEWAAVASTQNTFFHIFDFLFRHAKRILLVSDRSPAQLRGMHERLITRFACGVTIEIEKPNTQLCADILRSKIRRDGLGTAIPEDVIQYVAQTVRGSVRDLEGVINSLMVYSIVDSADIDLKLAEKIVRRLINISDEPVTLDYIVDTVCEYTNVTHQDINGKSRKKDIVLARQTVMYLAQKMTNLPATRIGRLIGGRDHSTVIHSCKKMEKALQKDEELRQLVNTIKKSLEQPK